MQWDKSQNAGFSTAAKTWLPVPPSATQYNVENERNDPESIFNFYKRVIEMRRELPALRDGSYVAVNRDDPNVLAYLRKTSDGRHCVLVALNMSAEPQTVSFNLKGFGVSGTSLRVLSAVPNQSASELSFDKVTLAPFGVLISEVE
jgi:alpha-glucosidase